MEQRGGIFIQDTAISIDTYNQLVYLKNTDAPQPYDVLSCNIGSTVKTDIIHPDNESIFTVKPIENLVAARNKILAKGKTDSLKIAILGGGPSAIEVAGNIHQLGNLNKIIKPEITIFSGRELLQNSPPKVRELALASLHRRKIKWFTNDYVCGVAEGKIQFKEKKPYKADIILSAVGLTCSSLFKNSGLPVSPDNGLLVNGFLQSIDYKNIFGGGDGITFTPTPLNKVGVYAVRQGPILAHNLLAAFTNKQLLSFNPGGQYLLIYNLGDGTGILSKKSFIINGRLAFLIKNYIDRRFINKFKQ